MSGKHVQGSINSIYIQLPLELPYYFLKFEQQVILICRMLKFTRIQGNTMHSTVINPFSTDLTIQEDQNIKQWSSCLPFI